MGAFCSRAKRSRTRTTTRRERLGKRRRGTKTHDCGYRLYQKRSINQVSIAPTRASISLPGSCLLPSPIVLVLVLGLCWKRGQGIRICSRFWTSEPGSRGARPYHLQWRITSNLRLRIRIEMSSQKHLHRFVKRKPIFLVLKTMAFVFLHHIFHVDPSLF